MRGRRWALGLGLFASGLATATPASADEPTDLEQMLAEPVVQTASKSAEDEAAAPATTSSISAEDLRRYGIHSLDEAINYLSLGMITQNPLHAVEIGSRGVLITGDYGDHVLLLINGHAVNEQWDGTAYYERGAGIPFEMIDHIEIILGPGSVLYGAQAMLGVINVITKRAKDYQGLHEIAESDVWTSWRGALGAGYEFQLLGKPAEVTAQIEYYQQDGPAFTFAPQKVGLDGSTGLPVNYGPGSTYPAGTWGGTVDKQYYSRVPAGLMRLEWGDFEATFKASTFQRATPYYTPVTTTGDFNDPNAYEIDRFFFGDLKHRWAISPVVQLRSRVYGDSYDYALREHFSAPQNCSSGTDGCAYTIFGLSRWLGIEEQFSFDWLKDNTLTTLVGAEARYRYVGAQNDETDSVTGVNPGSRGVYVHHEAAGAAYLQQTWQPWQWLHLNAGARLDADQRIDGPHVSPRAAIGVNPWKNGTLKGIYSEAFRAPTSYETSYTDNAGNIPSPGLRPESVRSFELSFEQRFGVQRILFGGFQSTWKDLISSTQLDPNDPAFQSALAAGTLAPGSTIAYQNRNIDTIESFGWNAAFDGSLFHRDLRYGINATGAFARRVDASGTKNELPVAPQVFGNARISYDLPGNWPVLGLVAQYVAKRPADRYLTGGFTPMPYAPPQVELRATVSGPFPWVSGLSYRVSADYAFAATNPYVVGPIQSATADVPSAALSPVDQFRATVGLQYDIR